jgi:hypothetical protein
VAPLQAGERRQRSFLFSTGTHPAGEVAVVAQVTTGAGVLASCSAGARIASSLEQGVHLVGSIVADPAAVFFGDAVTLRYSVQNAGNTALEPANIEILIANPVTGHVAARLTDSAALAVGATFNAIQPAPQDLAVAEYVVVLRGGPDNDLRTLASAPLSVQVPPNSPPACDGAIASLPVLWPPNHKFVRVGVRGVTDPDGDPVTIHILGVTQDEGVLGRGSGNTCPDAVLDGDGVQVRAERSGRDTGRVYRIRFEGRDPIGATCSGEVKVCVPHDQAHGCVESPEVHDATVCPAG